VAAGGLLFLQLRGRRGRRPATSANVALVPQFPQVAHPHEQRPKAKQHEQHGRIAGDFALDRGRAGLVDGQSGCNRQPSVFLIIRHYLSLIPSHLRALPKVCNYFAGIINTMKTVNWMISMAALPAVCKNG